MLWRVEFGPLTVDRLTTHIDPTAFVSAVYPTGGFMRSLGRIARTTSGATLLALLGVVGLAASPAAAQVSTSQANSPQLNQLILFETTPNTSATGEGYATANFNFFSFGSDHDNFTRYQFGGQGQYSFTDQLAVGGLWGFEHDTTDHLGDHTGVNDLIVYGQYKLDQVVPHDVVDLTAQVDLIFPTGKASEGRGLGHFGVRPWIEAFKAWTVGPGILGAYANFGITLTTNVDVRFGLAATYEWEKIVGILEFDDIAGDNHGAPTVTFSPGVAYRGIKPLEFLLGIPIGMNNASPDVGVVVKATWNFQR
jgi:hypothetical protein